MSTVLRNRASGGSHSTSKYEAKWLDGPFSRTSAHHQLAAVEIAMCTLHAYDPCFAKAAEAGEPTFTLRAQDACAAGTIAYWCDVADLDYVARTKIDGANAIAAAMRAWPGRRLPD